MPSKIVTLAGFRSEFLDNERELYIYLPDGYGDAANEDVRYPVLYMQDGQHVFAADSRGGSWEAHKTADRLIAQGLIRPIIIVGVAHVTGVRVAEYMHPVPWLDKVFGQGAQGDLYERFLAEEVKPYIDRQYRTLPEAAHTGVLGSSAGGLMAYNLGFRRSETFGLVGALCPFFVRPDQSQEQELWLSEVHRFKPPIRVWMDVGGAEGFTVMERHVRTVVGAMIEAGFLPGADLMYHLVPESGHYQKDWAARLHEPLIFLFGHPGSIARSHLHGPETVSLTEPAAWFNPVDEYDSGFAATNLEGAYAVSQPSVLSVLPDGTIVPRREGAAEVTYTNAANQQVTRAVAVVAGLPQTVRVSFRVEVPPDTPDTEMIYAGIELPKIGERLYGGTFALPRGFAVEFRISRGMGCDESDEWGREVPYRLLQAEEGLLAAYKVKGWIDMAPRRNGEAAEEEETA
ncbi:alpha/beta hydrolase [Cohnella sp. GbtcB17]|uniref:alpha/beta hydrolase n=1 Tax=Cohnella sp. GbtcB17 TaxID=2824762 RepID=UPI001C302936|nr:alpha/beta hydrolase-fold protein [Cohnella sp. GbtcB17]